MILIDDDDICVIIQLKSILTICFSLKTGFNNERCVEVHELRLTDRWLIGQH